MRITECKFNGITIRDVLVFVGAVTGTIIGTTYVSTQIRGDSATETAIVAVF